MQSVRHGRDVSSLITLQRRRCSGSNKPPCGPLLENVTSSAKPEVHGVSQFATSPEEDWAAALGNQQKLITATVAEFLFVAKAAAQTPATFLFLFFLYAGILASRLLPAFGSFWLIRSNLYVAVGRLRLVLNAEGYEYTDLASHGTGLRFAFHSHDESPPQPEIVRGVILSVGTHAHVNFRSPDVSRLCLF